MKRQSIQHISNRLPYRVSINNEFILCRLSYPTHRIIDNSEQSFRIIFINQKSEIRQQILYFFSLIKRQPAIHSVRNIFPSQSIFEGSGLGIGTIQNSKIIKFFLIKIMLFPDISRHKIRFICIR